MKVGRTLYVRTRAEWRRWLARNHGTAREIWLVNPRQASGEPRLPYNDAVEEALCFGWIDSTNKRIDADHLAQRYTPRRPGSPLSPMNRERVRRLIAEKRMTAAGLRAIGDRPRLRERLVLAPDIAAALQADPLVWRNFRRFPASYKRIRVGWIDHARDRPREFRKRLAYFIRRTAKNAMYGMVR